MGTLSAARSDYRFQLRGGYDRLFGYALDEVDLLNRLPAASAATSIARAGRAAADRPGAARDRPRVRSHAVVFHPVGFATDRNTVYAIRAVSAIDEVDGLMSLTIARCELDVVYVFRPGDEGRLNLIDRIAREQLGTIGAQEDGYLHFESRTQDRHVNPVVPGQHGTTAVAATGRFASRIGQHPPATGRHLRRGSAAMRSPASIRSSRARSRSGRRAAPAAAWRGIVGPTHSPS